MSNPAHAGWVSLQCSFNFFGLGQQRRHHRVIITYPNLAPSTIPVTLRNKSGPIIIEGPPSAPQQGISMVVLMYPNLEPSTIPARDAGHMDPDSPPRDEDIKSCTHPNSSPFYEQVSNENPRSPPSASVQLEL